MVLASLRTANGLTDILSFMEAQEFPQKGFYQHYKHDPQGAPQNYMYEVVGIARNTEDNSFSVLYRPLYESEWMPPADFQSRPLEMFVESVEKEANKIPRFTKITDPELVQNLEKIKLQIYG